MMKLGGYTFDWNPDEMTIPERYRSISEVDTYGGSAIFIWDLLLQGAPIVLKWDWMSIDQYNHLKAKYNAGETVEFNPDTGGSSYNVIITSFRGEYFRVLHSDMEYRRRVSMGMSIRSSASTTTTTTTTTTSSTITITISSTTTSTTSSTSSTSSTISSTSSSTTTSTTSTTSSTTTTA